MMVNDFDDEQTLAEEEALAANENPADELNDLQKESEMPIEELMKLYGYGSAGATSSSSAGTSRKRRRRNERPSPQPTSAKLKKPSTENLPAAVAIETEAEVEAEAEAEAAGSVESPDEDAATTTTTTNNLENQSLNDDDTNFEEEEPSELNKLYTEMYDREPKDGVLKLEPGASDEEDLDYEPDDDEGKKTIMVGSDYQAAIPEGLCKYDDALPYENEDKMLWDPSKLSDADIEGYLTKFQTLASASGAASAAGNATNGSSNFHFPAGKHLRDDEQALFLLHQCGNNCEEALRRRRIGAVQPANTMSIWSEEECRNFENGLRLHGKCFHEIQASKVSDTTMSDLL